MRWNARFILRNFGSRFLLPWKLVFVSLKQVETLGVYWVFIVVPHCSNTAKNIFFLDWSFYSRVDHRKRLLVGRFSKFQHVLNVTFFNVRLERLFSVFWYEYIAVTKRCRYRDAEVGICQSIGNSLDFLPFEYKYVYETYPADMDMNMLEYEYNEIS